VNDTLTLKSGNFNVAGQTLSAANISFQGGTMSPMPSNIQNVNVSTSTFTAPANVTNLVVSNPSGVTLTNSPNISGQLDLNNGALITGANTVVLGSGANVIETPSNYVMGNISTTRTVSAGSGDAAESFGNMGISLGDGAENLGNVSITRIAGITGAITTVGTNESIRRKWSITADNQPVSGRTLTLSWPSSDDNNVIWSPIRRAQVWKSTDNGNSWFEMGDAVDVSGSNPRSISVDVTSFSDFTVSSEDSPLPVELVSFTASINLNTVKLNWVTTFEINNSIFDVERKFTDTWEKVGFVLGNGSTNELQNYSFSDNNMHPGSYKYRLKQIDFNGNYNYFNFSQEVIIGIPERYTLSQNYPNPFNPTTKINFDLKSSAFAMLRVYDITGREVRILVNEKLSAGSYSYDFNASELPSGVYFYQLQAEGFMETKKMILLK